MLNLSESLLASLDAGRALVVPDGRRAAAARLAYATVQAARGRTIWQTPSVLTWSHWLDREVVSASAAGVRLPRVLGDMEDWLLWRECALETARTVGIPASDSLVDGLHHAAARAADWEIPLEALARGAHVESVWLARTMRLFDARCRDLHAASPARTALDLDRCRSTAVDFAGFLPLTRAQRTLIERLRGAGGDLREIETHGGAARTSIGRATDAADELAMAAEWARARLLESPHRRLLVVVPGLSAVRPVLVRAFARAVDAPESTGAPAFTIEGGEPLAGVPLVRHALASLRFAVMPLEFETLAAWLRAPYWSQPDDAGRARLELWLRSRLGVRASVRQLAEALATAPAAVEAPATELARRLEAALGVLNASATARPVEWAERFASALAALGFRGSAGGSDDGGHVRFVEALNDLAALRTHTELSHGAALEWLERLVSRATFEPPAHDAAITITDAVGDPLVRYDGIWVTGLRAESWPQPARRDPFIPGELQLAAGLPAASPAAQLAQARALLAAWHRAAGELIVSWPALADDCEQAPSVLLGELRQASPYTTATTLSIPHLMHASRIVEAFEDGMGEPWQQGRPLPGGTRSIEHQIRCAFRAYAELRLEALPLEPPRPGLDRRDRGRLVHRALELVWNELRDSVRLAAGRGPALGRLIGRAVERAVGDLLAENPGEGRERALRREQRRVARLVAELCELEGRRAPFAVVRSETNRTLRFEGATLHVRIDRIDRLDDGTLALLDYKTGGPQTQDWLGERPSHPQLLVYLLAVDGEVSAVATAHLATGRVSFRGIADRDGRLPKVAGLQAAAWPRQLEAWRMLVEQAVRDFLGGRAVRDPIEGACTHCHLHAVCRIGDATAWGGDER